MGTKRAYLNRVKLKSEALARAGMWPSNDPGKVCPSPWLKNFAEAEVEMAAALLDIFVFFPDSQVTQLLRRALRLLFQEFGGTDLSVSDRKDRIRDRLEKTVFVPVEGEPPNPTDSGNYMCRCARQTLELRDTQVRDPGAALQHYLDDGKTIVFLDDMVGTGNQMRATWVREYGSSDPKSFREAYAQTKLQCYYVCLACSKEGRNSLATTTGITLISAHDLQDRDRLDEALQRIPDHPAGSGLQADVKALIKKHATTLELDPYMRQYDFRFFGFGHLGLTLGFQHSMPDATLPIYWADGRDGWTPLSKRK